MSGPRIGELFAGYGGLGMGVQSVYGGSIAWVSDIDKGANKILAHRFPGVPNIGDITTVDWSQVEPVDILTGGSPCQDLSHAGRRAGMTEGTRSNLWVAMREAIAQLRPGVVVWENVRGAFSAAATSELEPCPGCVGDGSGVHLRALGRVLGDLSDLGYDTSWHGLRAADVGAPHGRFRVFVVATDTQGYAGRVGYRDGGVTADADGGVNVRGVARPDQRAIPNRDGGSPSAALLPTPTSSDSNGAGAHGAGGVDLRTAITMLPTPQARDWKGAGPADANRHDPNLSAIGALLPTPTSADAKASGSAGYGGNEFCTLTDATVRGHGGMAAPLLQTPSVADGTGGHERRGGARAEELLLNGQAQQMHGGQWGDYAPAIARWERVVGRPAPAPTMTSTKGNPQLSPRFVEFLMGLPDGWITDVPGITRNEALKALGNGVVSQQCAEALRVMESWVVAA